MPGAECWFRRFRSQQDSTAAAVLDRAVWQAIGPPIAGADLIVAGAPVIAFGLSSDRSRGGLERASASASVPADLSHPPLRTWLAELPAGRGAAAAFETRIWWSPRGATGTIERGLAKAGYRPIAKGQKFVVTGGEGPLRDGELDRARAWGRELADVVRSRPAPKP
jgi:hypothetical protein